MKRRVLHQIACVVGGVVGLVGVSAAAASPLPSQLWWARPDGLYRAVEAQGGVAPRGVGSLASATPIAPVPPSQATPRVPLGSTWKLFAYAWLQSTGAHEPAYRCAAPQPAADDEYCCDPGAEVGRDAALARSCGPYFSPARLQIEPQAWRRFWQARSAPAWLASPAAFDPATRVEVASLLDALARIPDPAREASRAALLPLSLRLGGVIASIGAGPRFKTWSWTIDGERAGGGAGWLADGTPFWFGAPGSSRNAWQAHAAWIARTWEKAGLRDAAPERSAVAAEPCVAVTLFKRYPIASVQRADGKPAAAGTLVGPQRVLFANGNRLAIDASPGLQLRGDAGSFKLEARWPLEDYVARVVDREGDAAEPAASRALAVAARSYLLQNARDDQGCHRIDDDSRTQRVSPNPPTAAARDAAAFTRGLVLDGPPVRYHRDQAAEGQMAWQGAVQAAHAGASFERILQTAYPASHLSAIDASADCLPLQDARDWLVAGQRRWREQLRREAGFEPLPDTLQVCRLAMGVPRSDQRLLQIRVRSGFDEESRLTLVHEYLHLAFRHHPRGRDDAYVERLARQLLDS